jgi:transposase-like protein
MPVVVASAMSLQQRARLIDAFRGRANLSFVESVDVLSATLRERLKIVDAVVIPARDPAGVDAPRIVREIARERPRTAIIAYVQTGAQYSTEIRALALAGTHEFVFLGIDDGRAALRAILSAARRECAADWVMRHIAPLVPAKLHPMVEMALTRPDAVTTVSGLADAMGVQRNTLFNWCTRANFIAPEEVLIWARLALVGFYLESTGCTVERIALELAFASDTALRNAIKRYTGYKATALRDAGALAEVLRAFGARLERGPRRHGILNVR